MMMSYSFTLSAFGDEIAPEPTDQLSVLRALTIWLSGTARCLGEKCSRANRRGSRIIETIVPGARSADQRDR